MPGHLPQTLSVQLAEDTPPSAFPNGCHVAEVEIDPDTGHESVIGERVFDPAEVYKK